jgi:(1->4)-alpha-D-glucan 1-alpha-D-glucosylmutase
MGTFRPEVERLARELRANDGVSVTTGVTKTPKFIEGLARALSSLPIYRTYIDPATRTADDRDHAAIAGLDPEFQRLMLDGPPGFVTRFQQTTPAIMAKGVEDTAFYRYGRLLALNDVGGDPSRFVIDVDRFHAGCVERAERFPLGLLTTMTHDAKRSGDVRARIGALASIADEWTTVVGRWFDLTDGLRRDGAPDDIERYFLFQTLVGAWPIERERVESYMVKALREAKRNTAWVEPNEEYEQAVVEFCRALYGDEAFMGAFEAFAARLAAKGDRDALGQLVLKLTVPGIPDTYRGDELPYRALVDPDNRRPVDWDLRQAMLKRLMGGSPVIDETRKRFWMMRLLGLRARRPEPFWGGYEPLDAGSEVCAFVRGGDLTVAVAVRDGEATAGATLADPPGGRWRDVLTGQERSFDSHQPLAGMLDERGIGVFERL